MLQQSRGGTFPGRHLQVLSDSGAGILPSSRGDSLLHPPPAIYKKLFRKFLQQLNVFNYACYCKTQRMWSEMLFCIQQTSGYRSKQSLRIMLGSFWLTMGLTVALRQRNIPVTKNNFSLTSQQTSSVNQIILDNYNFVGTENLRNV